MICKNIFRLSNGASLKPCFILSARVSAAIQAYNTYFKLVTLFLSSQRD